MSDSCDPMWHTRHLCPWDFPGKNTGSVQFRSVTQLCQTLCDPMDWSMHAWPSCPPSTPGVYSNSCPLSQWCHPTISFSIIPFSSSLHFFPASAYFPMSQFFTLGGQSIRVFASASVIPMNIQDWFPLGSTGWVSLKFIRLSKVCSKTSLHKH